VWSKEAAIRALRATLVVPGLFAFADQVVGNLQVATFAAFGGFATLVMSSFGGTRRDKAVAHLGLALAGSALVAVGTLVSSSTLLASLVTLPVTFVILFAGAIEPNAASGAMGALSATEPAEMNVQQVAADSQELSRGGEAENPRHVTSSPLPANAAGAISAARRRDTNCC